MQQVEGENIGSISEQHFVNFFDEISDLPEYQPLSLDAFDYNIMQKMEKTKDGFRVSEKMDPIELTFKAQ